MQVTPPADEQALVDRFLRVACLSYSDEDPADSIEATELLRKHPRIATATLASAAVCGNLAAVQRLLNSAPELAVEPCGPYGWSPLMYLAYSRFEVAADATLAIAQSLIEHGADPDDGRLFLGLPTPFTVLTGVFGGGERGESPHPQSIPLARLLLTAGAEPNDGQTLYNRMFEPEDDFLELLLEFGLGRGDGGPWRRRSPELDPPEAIVGKLLAWAVTHDQRARVALLARHGVDVRSPLADGRTPIDIAVRNGHRALAQELTALGAPAPELTPVDRFVAAALAGDRAAAEGTPADVVAAAREDRPALLVWAAGLQRQDAVELLVRLGFDIDAYGRADVVSPQKWQTALHTAVERADAALVTQLLGLGADKTLHDARFDGTPYDWAVHLGYPELAQLLAEQAR